MPAAFHPGQTALPCLLALGLALGGCGGRGDPGEIRVLFVGNSRLYFHDQPAMVEALAAANRQSFAWEMYVEGGASLSDHIEDGVLDTIRSGKWTAVVANEQSTWGLSRFVEGAARVPDAPEPFFTSIDSLSAATDRIGATLVLLAHPRHREMPLEDGDRLIRGFADASARHPDVEIVPMESAWRIAPDLLSDVELYEPDGNHPTEVGALLHAIGIYRALFGALPASVPDTIQGPLVEEDDGIVHRDSIVDLVTLRPGMATDLVEVVRRAVERWPADVQEADHPPGDDLPRLPEPVRTIELADLRGTWEGELRVYPRFMTWPASMSLSIGGGEPWTASLRVSFGGTPPDIHYPTLPVSNEGAYLQFLDPDGPNGGFLRYRLVPDADTLKGIAEFTNDSTVYGIGSVRLTRAR